MSSSFSVEAFKLCRQSWISVEVLIARYEAATPKSQVLG